MTSKWEDIKQEGLEISLKDDFMTEVIDKSVLNHNSLSSSISYILAEQFDGKISRDKWYNLFVSVYNGESKYHEGMNNAEAMGLADLIAIGERDPASDGLVNPLLYFKGYKALQSHRIAHILWQKDRRDTARAIQSRCSEIYAVDIHPGAVIGIFYFTIRY